MEAREDYVIFLPGLLLYLGMGFKSLLVGPIRLNSRATDFGLMLLRIFAGLSLAFAHGIGKIPASGKFIRGVDKLGFPLPEVFAWGAGISEFLGGILLALGLFTRPSAVFIAITMSVAAFLRHANDPFGSKEKALLYLGVAIMFLIAGPGRYSIDSQIVKR